MNFARFYAALNRMPLAVDREEVKRLLVLQFTDGRTESLREVRRGEYEAMCIEVEKRALPDPARQMRRNALRMLRSQVLHQMQLYGVDTSDWTIVDRFCQDRRIAGKTFRSLHGDELEALYRKLRAIRQKKEKAFNSNQPTLTIQTL